MRLHLAFVMMTGLAVVTVGCATTDVPEKNLRASGSPVWSLQQTNDELVVSVSPAGRTLRIAGSAGLVIGTGVDAVVNARYRSQIEDLIGEDDTAATLAKGLETALQKAAGPDLAQVAPLSSTAGFDSKRDALAARYEGLADGGHDVLLRLRTTHGVFGHDATLAVKLDGKMVELPSGRTLWDNEIVATIDPVMAYDRLGDPTDRMTPRIKGARLTVEDEALAKWQSGRRSLRDDFQRAVEAAAAALVVNLQLADDPLGAYHLGELALLEKDFEEAVGYYKKALALKPDYPAAYTGVAVTQGHMNDIDAAVATAREATEEWPDYAPAFMNLAWWLAMEKDDVAAAKTCYAKALELGMAPMEKLEERLSESE